MPPPAPSIRRARPGDLSALQAIRAAAFAPVFASFRAILGDALYEMAQAPEDASQAEYLESLFEASSGWEVWAADVEGETVGFVSVRLDRDSGIGEIGLNAVHPDRTGRGIGTAMYGFALDRMAEAGLRVATVSTGADPSHAPARRAYGRAGFDVGIPSVWMCCDLRGRRTP